MIKALREAESGPSIDKNFGGSVGRPVIVFHILICSTFDIITRNQEDFLFSERRVL